MRWLTWLFWVWYLIGLVMLVFIELPPWLQFSKSVFLFLFAAYAVGLLIRDWGLSWIQAAWVIVPVGVLSLWIEAIGVATGHPFGTYTYGNEIGWKILGVPMTISFAWLAVTSTVVLFSVTRPRWLRAFEVGLWAMCFDLVLDPAAISEGFWSWHQIVTDTSNHSLLYVLWTGPAFYGIPFSNFVSWFGVAFLLSWFYPEKLTGARVRRRALRLYQAMLIFFAALCIKGGLWWPPVLAVLFIVISEWRERYDSRGPEDVV